MNINIDIIGANGYLGKGLSEFLKEKAIPFRRISRIRNEKEKILSFQDWLKKKSENVCIFLADPSYIDHFSENKYNQAIERFDKCILNTQGTFIYLSSSSVYLKKNIGSYRENDQKCNKNIYSKLKIRNEERLIDFCTAKNRRFIILRLPVVFDSYPKKGTLFEKIINTNNTGRLYLSGDYSFNQEFLYGQDLFNIIFNLLFHIEQKSLCLNLSSSIQVNIMSLIIPKFRYIACPRPNAILDNNKLLSILNYNFHIPQYSFEDNCIYWIKS